MIRLETERLILRDWEARDLAPFAAMNADPKVMEFFPSTLSEAESRAALDRIRTRLKQDGLSFQPIEERGSGRFAGALGLARVAFDAHFTPAVEIAWRLPFAFWGQGYATEAASALRDYGLIHLGLHEIVSFTAGQNRRSRAVMTRIGMTQDTHGDFLHPALDPNHRLARHVLYRARAL